VGSRAGHGNWDEQYAGAVAPPWEIGRVQPALVARIERISIESPVLDAGCGTGELAILLASRGHQVLGIDSSTRAITVARAKAVDASCHVAFRLADAEHLDDLDLRPRTVFDSGLLHNLDRPGQRAYLAGLAAICDPGAVVHVLAVCAAAGSGWDLTQRRLHQLFGAPQWVDTRIEMADVLALVDGEELHLPSFLLAATRAPRSSPSSSPGSRSRHPGRADRR
jgi:SAM-dependent methyltransferase